MLVASRRAVGWHSAALAVVFAPPRWRPNVDVCETSTALTVTVELAGVGADDVELLLYEDALVLEGERRLASCGADGVFHEVGIRRGLFRVEVPLDVAIEAGDVDARQEQGLLYITLPKARG
jgi:HSP20 family protein